MEDPSPSERVAAPGSDDEHEPVRDGIGVDGQWECQRVHQGAQGCGSVRARTFLVLTVNRFAGLDSRLILTAQGCCPGIGIYARRGGGAWGSKGGKSSRVSMTLPSPD